MVKMGSENLWKALRSGQSDEIFAEIVRQYSGMVFATALRCSNGAHGIAEDIMQEVFCNLVRKSKSLPRDLCLGGWLYRHTCHLAANQRRSESRRRKREISAASLMNEQNANLPSDLVGELDAALCSLPKKSREMLVMRFFESADYGRIAEQFGTTNEAVRKRVTRALERLRSLLERRGVGVSGVALAAGLTSLSVGKVSAAKQQELVGQAMAVPVGSAGLIGSVTAFLVGVISVSGVAIGMQKWDASHDPPPVVSTSLTPNQLSSEKRVVKDAESEKKEDLFARLQALADGPQHALTMVELRALLAQIPVDEIPGFVEDSKGVLTSGARKFCNNILCARWIDHAPETNLLAAMREGLSHQSGVGVWLYRVSGGRWADKDPEAMMQWLIENEEFINGLNLRGANGPLFYDFSENVVDSFMHGSGIKRALESLDSFPSKTRAELLRHLTGAKLTGLRASDAPHLYEYLRTRSVDQSIWTGFLRNWAEEDPKALLATLDRAPAEERFRDKLLLFKGIRPTGPPVETADGSITMSTKDGKVYASLSERERQVYEAGIEAGYSLEKIQEEVANAHRSSGNSYPFSGKDGTEQPSEIDYLKERMATLEIQHGDSRFRLDLAESYHPLIWRASRIEDEGVRKEICESLFQSFLRHGPDQARRFSEMPHLPEDLKKSFQPLIR